MWRALFTAFGINLMILGAQCLVVEGVVVNRNRMSDSSGNRTVVDNVGYQVNRYNDSGFGFASHGQPAGNSISAGGRKTYFTQDWMPWSLLAGGAIIVIYTQSITRRFS